MSYKNIRFTIENGVAGLVLARHDIRNAYSDREFTDEIVDAINQAQRSAEARVLVLSAEGSAFSAGGNIKDMRDQKGIFGGGPAAARRGYIEGIQQVPKALYGLDIPSIAAVQGPAHLLLVEREGLLCCFSLLVEFGDRGLDRLVIPHLVHAHL